MIDYETFCRIRKLHDQEGLNASQIATELCIDRNTATKWVKRPAYRPRKTVVRPSKLDLFKPDIARLLEKHDYTATQILQRIREQGFEGGSTIVADYVRKIRPRRSTAYLKLSFAPGECAQVDWGCYGSVNVGNTRRRLSFFVMTLCYCRMSYVEFTVSQTMEHFLACHQKAFEFFGGIPERVMMVKRVSVPLTCSRRKNPVSSHCQYIHLISRRLARFVHPVSFALPWIPIVTAYRPNMHPWRSCLKATRIVYACIMNSH